MSISIGNVALNSTQESLSAVGFDFEEVQHAVHLFLAADSHTLIQKLVKKGAEAA